MSRFKSLGLIAVLVVGGSLAIAADEPKKAPKPIKLVNPWSKLTDLTDEQKVKINDLHQEALAAIKDIKAKEEADIMAVLTSEQRDELRKLEAEEKAAEKAKRAEQMKEKSQD